MFLTGRWISRPEDIYFLSLGRLFFTDSVAPNISATVFPQKQMKVVRRHMMLWSACVLWSNNCTQTNVSVALLNAAYKRLWLPRNSQQSYGALKRSQVFALSVSALKTATINLRVHRVTDNLSVGTVTTDCSQTDRTHSQPRSLYAVGSVARCTRSPPGAPNRSQRGGCINSTTVNSRNWFFPF